MHTNQGLAKYREQVKKADTKKKSAESQTKPEQNVKAKPANGKASVVAAYARTAGTTGSTASRETVAKSAKANAGVGATLKETVSRSNAVASKANAAKSTGAEKVTDKLSTKTSSKQQVGKTAKSTKVESSPLMVTSHLEAFEVITTIGVMDAEDVAEAVTDINQADDLKKEATYLKEELADEIEQELVVEMERDQKRTSTLVRDDFSPVNCAREKLIVEYAPLIKYIAQKIASRLPANIELDDLMSSGVIGLMDAIDKYDSSRDNKFKTYAEFRIRGAILDELRSQDWVPRSVREKSKMLERAYAKIEQEKGRHGTDEEVCAELGVSQEEFHELLNEVRSVSLLSWDEMANFSKADKRALHGLQEGGSKAPTPFSEVSVAHIKQLIAEAIGDLPEKHRLVLSLYYYEDLNLKEIGRVLDVTESRVSQLHTQAVIRLKGKLKSHWDDFLAMVSN